MLCSLLNRDLGSVCRSVVGFLDRSISRAMGCFFGCFRDKDDRRHHDHHHRHRCRANLVSETSRSIPTEVVSQNRLSSLFSSEDKEDSPCKDSKSACFGSPTIDNELKNEAKFLKACGTLVETPVEIRKASRLNGSPLHDGDTAEHSKFNSWLHNTSIKKLQLENQPDQPPTPIKISEERGKGSDLSEHTPSSCLSNVQSSGSVSNSCEGSGMSSVHMAAKVHANETEKIATLVSPWISATDQCRSKTVRFECDFDLSSSRDSSSEYCSQNLGKSESPANQSITKPLPYPTPLKLSDEMQTPGTVFPANMESFPNGKSRIRSQYVYSVLNPVQSSSQWKALKEDDYNFDQLSDELRESLEEAESATPKSKEGVKETSSGKELKVEASLSSWLKPVSSNQDRNHQNFRPHAGRTPVDRPIIGMVAAHWIEDEPSRISPKWWDGNGIPNSTNKYKEDQKVSWHATPFEERLEKALSEESVVTQRKHAFGNPIVFDENEESDTALSQLQSSSHPKSVVTC
ncbi:protein JASON [Ziziphus jujuba]|uniref:Protein JASON n=1 Tax=Ziziphus jujuba TaxID=326968 RepID=A0ABM3IH83_ZIZJJ|nr:protein JASON [Ziziphus jujuba]